VWLKILNKIKSAFSWRQTNLPSLLKFAPYEPNSYRELLLRLKKNRNIVILPFTHKESYDNRINFFIRHDIDTKECITSMDVLIDIDYSLAIPSGIYFRVDDEEYRLRDFRDQIRLYKRNGFEIGLHSLCYTKDDYMNEFDRETVRFSNELGFRPRSFTLHGLGDYRSCVRLDFTRIISSKLDEFGYEFTDCDGNSRNYAHVIHDCHLDSINQRRFMREDFELNFPFRRGCCYLVLTHPCYWAANS